MNFIFWLEDWYKTNNRLQTLKMGQLPFDQASRGVDLDYSHLLSDIFLPLFSLSPGEVCHVRSFSSSMTAPHRRGGNRPATLLSTGQIWYFHHHSSALYLLVLLRAWTGTRSEDDTSPCCREEIVWSRLGSLCSTNWMKCPWRRTTWDLLRHSPAHLN